MLQWAHQCHDGVQKSRLHGSRFADLLNGRRCEGHSRHDVKPATKQIYSRSRHFLIEFFGAERRLDSITWGDADEWALYLRSKLNENTSRKMAAVAKLFFKRADRKGLIEFNPFSDMRCNVTHDETGDFTVTPEIIQSCLAIPFRTGVECLATGNSDVGFVG